MVFLIYSGSFFLIFVTPFLLERSCFLEENSRIFNKKQVGGSKSPNEMKTTRRFEKQPRGRRKESRAVTDSAKTRENKVKN